MWRVGSKPSIFLFWGGERWKVHSFGGGPDDSLLEKKWGDDIFLFR